MAMWETPRLLRLGVSADILVDLASSCQRVMLCGGYGHRHSIDLEVPSVVLLRPGPFVAIVALCWMSPYVGMEGLDTVRVQKVVVIKNQITSFCLCMLAPYDLT